jgi:hypothetical protein
LFLCAGGALAADTTLISPGSTWKYLADGSDQGTTWRGTNFNDSAWLSGPAQLGYGDGGEATVVNCGPSAPACNTGNFITTYFRRAFAIADAAAFGSLQLQLLRDDGAVVYLNGTEVVRHNMPAGTITYTTPASTAIGGADESTFYSFTLATNVLLAGTNVAAVEIHQSSGTSSDISFDLQLVGVSTNVAATRGPYLQLGTPDSMIVRWRTSGPTDSRVRYGTNAANLDLQADTAAVTTEHIVGIAGLSPDTKYFYSVGSTTEVLAGGDTNHFFVTAPPPGSRKRTRLWVLGDSGTADANAAAVRNAYVAFAGTNRADLCLMLGDNAYNDGTDAEYQTAVFDMYPAILRNTVLWTTLGNHDGHTANSTTQSGPYYDIFSLPTNGVAGGMASGTEAYYSFDYGNIHFICLESYETDRSTSGPMLTWLQADLASTSNEWIIAFWHHPPYSKGSHDSDVDIELIEMRQNALPILEAHGVDLVLCGHSHSYERSKFIDGHYVRSSTFTNTMIKQAGLGRDAGAYQKPDDSPHAGAVYAVAGSSGQVSSATGTNHPAMITNLYVLGSMVLDIHGDRLDAKFIDSGGSVRDYFTILKTPPIAYPPGDVNGDFLVTGADSLLINQVQVGLRSNTHPIFTATGFANGDVNQNGAVSGGDSLLINQAQVGLRSYLVTRSVPAARDTTVPTTVRLYGITIPTNAVSGVTIGSPVNLTLSNVTAISREQVTALIPPGGGIGTGTVNVIATPTNGVISFGTFINQ